MNRFNVETNKQTSKQTNKQQIKNKRKENEKKEKQKKTRNSNYFVLPRSFFSSGPEISFPIKNLFLLRYTASKDLRYWSWKYFILLVGATLTKQIPKRRMICLMSVPIFEEYFNNPLESVSASSTFLLIKTSPCISVTCLEHVFRVNS